MSGPSATDTLRGAVAIVGMACQYAKAPDLTTFWHNVVAGVDAISDIPASRVSAAFFDSSSTANDRSYCRRAGLLGESAEFNPAEFGIMPVAVEGGEPDQFLALQAAQAALRDAGYDPERMAGDRTEVVLGRGNYTTRGLLNVYQHTHVVQQVVEVLQTLHPEYREDELARLREELKASLPPFGADNAASIVPNITTSRVANRFNLMGSSFTVDAACASSLVAAEIGVRDLLTGKCDLALVGGVSTLSNFVIFSIFTQLRALSPRSQIRPFDQGADGTLPGEGVGILALKRLEDAEAAGDRIYAVIRGVGTSSDGRGLGLLAPRVEGEELALRRAYAMAGVDPATVGLIEAHGTATTAGDVAEVQALSRVFGPREPGAAPRCAIGTVKSMIGHTMPAAGAAGLIKSALALYHKVLPPTLHCEAPNPALELEKTPFYINTVARPWVHGGDQARRAGTNAFGFGGVNAHVALEEYRGQAAQPASTLLRRWPSELFVLGAPTRDAVAGQARALAASIEDGAAIDLKDLAFTLNSEAAAMPVRLAVVAESAADLREKLERAGVRLADPACTQIKDPKGVYYFARPLASTGTLALLCPGEGSQYVGMLADLCMHFPDVRQVLDDAAGRAALDDVFPPPWPEERRRAERRLWSMSGAAAAVLTADFAVLRLLQTLQIRPDVVVGHSSGDLVAMAVAGILRADPAFIGELVQLMGAYDGPLGDVPEFGLLSVGAGRDKTFAQLGDLRACLTMAMDNCGRQVVLSGAAGVIEAAYQRLTDRGVYCERLQFNRPYHTEAFAQQSGPLRDCLQRLPMQPPTVPIYSCTTGDRYPAEIERIRQLSIDHWHRPVLFEQTIRKMYADGVRLFLEAGPRGNLTAFVDDILRGQPHIALSVDQHRRHGLTQLNHVLGILSAHGVPLSLDALYQRRSPCPLKLDELGRKDRQKADGKPLELAVTHVRLKGPIREAVDGVGRTSPSAARSLNGVGEGTSLQPLPYEGRGIPGVVGGTVSPPWTRSRPPSFPGEGAGGEVDRAGEIRNRDQPMVGMESESAVRATVAPAMQSAGRPAPTRREVSAEPMRGYFQAMEQFLTVQNAVMQAALAPAPGLPSVGTLSAVATTPPSAVATKSDVTQRQAPATVAQPDPRLARPAQAERADWATRYPLLGNITACVPGQTLQAERRLTTADDVFLQDHRFSEQISADPTLEPVAVVPMTVSLEVMAEAAAALLPGRRVVGLRGVYCSRWITVSERATVLHISARADPAASAPDQVTVEIRFQVIGDPAPSGEPAARAVVLLDRDYPVPAVATAFAPLNAKPFGLTMEQVHKYLFHGPRFRTISAVSAAGDDGIIGDLAVPALDRFLGAQPSRGLILDPVVLDGIGQLKVAWTYERISSAEMVYPVRIDEFSFFGPRCTAPAVLRCHVHLLEVGDRRVRMDAEVLRPDGRVHIRVAGWQSIRFHLPPQRAKWTHWPASAFAGERWDAPVQALPAAGRYVAVLMDGLAERSSNVFAEVIASIILNRAERDQWRSLAGSAKRRDEWLLGRSALKDVTRMYLQQYHGLTVFPADVEVGVNAQGRALVTGPWLASLPAAPAVALAQTGMVAVAVIGGANSDDYLGVALERIQPRDADFLARAFSDHEQRLLAAVEQGSRQEWVTRLWCVKEALANALGYGPIEDPAAVSIGTVDWATGVVLAQMGGAPAQRDPQLRGAPIKVCTACAGGLAVAATACERQG